MVQIRSIKISGKALLAPMAGITDLPFRLLCKEQGAALVFTEMISAEGLIRRQGGTEALLESRPEERPVAYQIFGRKSESMAGAARILSDGIADIIDINMGCPVRKVTRGGSGAALMREPEEAGKVISAVVEASSVPVTVKIRKGWGPKDFRAVELARIAEAAGAAAITVHGRTAAQGYSGRADWSAIKAVKEAVTMPVIGNGDVTSAADAARMMDETGCDAVMVGRGALGNPWVFREINRYLLTGSFPERPSIDEKKDMLLRHFGMMARRHGGEFAAKVMRKHAAWYSRGMAGAAEFRKEVNAAGTEGSFVRAVEAFFGYVRRAGA